MSDSHIETAVFDLAGATVREDGLVGDAANDVLAARRAGAGICAAVITGAHDHIRLSAAHPTHLPADVGEFTRLLTTVPNQ
ncbi:HAD hydrolase-like protein [Streptomyces scopuliridis]